MKVYLGNLSPETTEQQLRGLVTPFGKTDSVVLVMDKATGKARGFGFAEFGSVAEGNAAIAGLNGKQIEGKNLIVNERADQNKRFSRVRELSLVLDELRFNVPRFSPAGEERIRLAMQRGHRGDDPGLPIRQSSTRREGNSYIAWHGPVDFGRPEEALWEMEIDIGEFLRKPSRSDSL